MEITGTLVNRNSSSLETLKSLQWKQIRNACPSRGYLHEEVAICNQQTGEGLRPPFPSMKAVRRSQAEKPRRRIGMTSKRDLLAAFPSRVTPPSVHCLSSGDLCWVHFSDLTMGSLPSYV
ncbi:uncharacterized protein LOC143032131 [Oratosquilla oratoria]|uniref:uncharacterized protein LOC143032131 n=1 Tax=Oratosquilla oratoria TaxID=337810 RepID=UPI003F76DEC8